MAFLVAAALAGVATFLWHPVVARWENLILTLDAAGLALFCVIGALKASNAGLDIVPAALLGMITAIGGGIARDVLANRVPVVLEGGWYADASARRRRLGGVRPRPGLVDRRRAAPRHRGLLHLAGPGPAPGLVTPAGPRRLTSR